MLGWLRFDLPVAAPSGVFLVLFLVVLVMTRLAENLQLPGVVGLTVGGMLIGPSGFGVLEREGPVALLGGASLLFLMFEAGRDLQSIRRKPLRSRRYCGPRPDRTRRAPRHSAPGRDGPG